MKTKSLVLKPGLKKVLKLTNRGIYVLEMFIREKIDFHHNALGNHSFQKGYYYYAGSAQKNLSQRIERHIKKNKKRHWHIDYLTSNNNIEITNVYLLKNYSKNYECKLVKVLIEKYDLEIIIRGFGNSDCKSCESHLLYSNNRITYNHFCSLYQDTVLFIPSCKDFR